jgi:hypothetical protein
MFSPSVVPSDWSTWPMASKSSPNAGGKFILHLW